MRKEVYKRKPKEAFKRLKPHQKARSGKLKEPNAPTPEFYLHKPFKPAYQRWWFKLFATLVIVFIIYSFLDRTVWAEQRLEKQVEVFDETGIVEFYKENNQAMDSILAFMAEKEGKLSHVLRNWNSGLRLGFRSFDYEKRRAGRLEGPHHRSSQFKKEQEKYFVEDGDLKYEWMGNHATFSDYWSFDLYVKHLGEVPPSFLDHINCTRAELDKFVRFVAGKGWEVEYYENGSILHFKNLKSRYSIYLTDSLEAFTEKDLKQFQTIEKGVYWTKTSYWY